MTMSDDEIDKLDDRLISTHEEMDDYTGEKLIVATCDCGRSWVVMRGGNYWRTRNQWRHIVRVHAKSLRHAVAMREQSKP